MHRGMPRVAQVYAESIMESCKGLLSCEVILGGRGCKPPWLAGGILYVLLPQPEMAPKERGPLHASMTHLGKTSVIAPSSYVTDVYPGLFHLHQYQALHQSLTG